VQEIILTVDKKQQGLRLDCFIVQNLLAQGETVSRTQAKRLIQQGKIISLQNISLKPHHKVKEGQQFKIIWQKNDLCDTLIPENIPLKIIYEDNDIAVIYKPSGLVVHPAAGNLKHTLVNAILYRFKQLSSVNPKRPGIVHRLDKDTSGVMVIAKNNLAHYSLARQFAEHSITREYVAIVKGKIEFDEDVLELPICRHPRQRKKLWVGFGKNSRYAKTRYKTIIRRDDASLIKLFPFTGRTHQLRVHLAFIGHPVLGDLKYDNDKSFSRLALHACLLGFMHPVDNKYVEFSTAIPKEFLDYFGLKSLKI